MVSSKSPRRFPLKVNLFSLWGDPPLEGRSELFFEALWEFLACFYGPQRAEREMFSLHQISDLGRGRTTALTILRVKRVLFSIPGFSMDCHISTSDMRSHKESQAYFLVIAKNTGVCSTHLDTK